MQHSSMTGVGCRRGGFREGIGEYFCTSVSEHIIIYGLFADCNDKIASKFAAKHFPLEFLNLWKENVDKPDISVMLKTTFEIIENKLLQLHVNMKIDGTSALVAVICGSELYIVHTGCSRALLYLRNENVTHINQLTFDHNLKNAKEMKRLTELGVDVSKLNTKDFYGHSFTRCLGNINLKQFFGKFPSLSSLNSSPWIAEPDILGPIELNETCVMIVMMSSGIVNFLSDGGFLTDDINSEIILRINHQFLQQPTVNDAAQAVLDEIVSSLDAHNINKSSSQEADSLFLIIHCFQNPFLISSNNHFQFTMRHMTPLTVDVDQNGHDNCTQFQSFPMHLYSPHSSKETMKSVTNAFSKSPSNPSKLPLDECGRIAPYIDFSSYYNVIDQLSADHKLESNPDFCALMEFEKISGEIINS